MSNEDEILERHAPLLQAVHDFEIWLCEADGYNLDDLAKQLDLLATAAGLEMVSMKSIRHAEEACERIAAKYQVDTSQSGTERHVRLSHAIFQLSQACCLGVPSSAQLFKLFHAVQVAAFGPQLQGTTTEDAQLCDSIKQLIHQLFEVPFEADSDDILRGRSRTVALPDGRLCEVFVAVGTKETFAKSCERAQEREDARPVARAADRALAEITPKGSA